MPTDPKPTTVLLRERDLKRVKAAAKKANMTQSAFIRAAMVAAADEILNTEKCTACGRPHPKDAA